MAAGGLGGLALVLLGIWVIIKDKDGNEVARVKVPEGGTAVVEAKNLPVKTNISAAATSPIQSETLPGISGLRFLMNNRVELPDLKLESNRAYTIEVWMTLSEPPQDHYPRQFFLASWLTARVLPTKFISSTSQSRGKCERQLEFLH